MCSEFNVSMVAVHNTSIVSLQVLMDATARMKYNARLETALADDEDDYTGQPLSKWAPTACPSLSKAPSLQENRAVFVDENTCIGCKQCVWHAPATFRIEAEYGRSRVFGQWLNTEDDLQAAIGVLVCCHIGCRCYWCLALCRCSPHWVKQ